MLLVYSYTDPLPLLQAGLGPIRQRLHQETCGRYGFKEAFTGADAETMRLVLKEVKKRYVLKL